MSNGVEHYRPRFHFTAPTGWHNDPNGLVFYQGEYHLFYQHNPFGTEWGNMTWGHALSSDLVHWQHLPRALEPDAMGTMFSGSAVVDWDNRAGFAADGAKEKTLIAFYTAAGSTSPESEGQPFTQCLAYSHDRGRTWIKYEGNPIIEHIKAQNRDPKVFWHAPSQRWVMALFIDEPHHFALFSSANLKTWQHLQDLALTGTRECPDFFELPIEGEAGQSKWVFTGANGRYYLGTFDGQLFILESGPHRVDWGHRDRDNLDGNYYAVQSYSDIPEADGRRIQIAWMAGGKYPDMPFNQQMNFPNELRLRRTADGIRLCRQPVAELSHLHGQAHTWEAVHLNPKENLLAGLEGECLDIRLTFSFAQATALNLRMRGKTLRVEAASGELACLEGRMPLDTSGQIELQILLDITSIEIFAQNGERVISTCFLPDLDDTSLSLTVEGGQAEIHTLQIQALQL